MIGVNKHMSEAIDVQGGCVLFVSDMDRMASFYQGVMGLERLSEDASHVRLFANGFELVVHQLPAAIASGIAINNPPDLRASSPAKVVYRVDDIDSARAQATALEGQLFDVDTQWEFAGMLVCDGWDPEGNVFQLRQLV